MSTIAEMVVKLGADQRDLLAAFASSEARAQAFSDHLTQIEASAQTNAAMLAAEREAKAAASAARTQRNIEQAFRMGSGAQAAVLAPSVVAHAKEELGVLASMHEQVAHHAGNHSLAIGRLEMSLERFSAEALGVNHTLGLVIAGLAKFGLGSLETAGALAGLAAIAAIWEHLTGAAREAAKEQDKAIASFEKLQHAKLLGPQGEAIEAINARVAAAKAAAEANQRLIDNARAPATGIDASGAVNPFASAEVGTQMAAARAAHNVEEARRNQDRLNADLREAVAERNRILRQQSESDESHHVADLAALLKFAEHDKAIRAQALADLKTYQAALAAMPTSASLTERAAMAGNITALHNALFPKSEAHDAEREQAARISGLVTEMDNLRLKGQAYSQVMIQLLDIYGSLGAGAKRLNETWEQFQTRTQQIHTIVKAISDVVSNIHMPDIKPPTLPDVTVPTTYEQWLHPMLERPQTAIGQMAKQLDDMVAAAQLLQKNLEVTNAARATRGDAPVDNTSIMLEHQRAIAEQVEAMRRAYMGTGLPVQIINTLMDALLEKLKAAGIDVGTLKDSFIDINKAIDAVAAVGNLADALGAKDLASFLNNAANAASAVAEAAAQGWTNPAADVNAAASIINTVKGLFDSPLHREQLQLMRENNQKLAQVALALQGFHTNASNITSAGQAAAAAISGGAGTGIQAGTLFGDLQTQIDALQPYLKAVGLSWLQFAQITKDAGINIFDSHGRIVIGALEQFANATHDAVKALFTFSSSFNDQLALINLQEQLNGPQTAAQQMQAQLDAILKTAPHLLPQGLDTGTVEGRNATRDALQQLIAGIANGTIDPSQFGGFQNLQELLSAITPLISALNDLTGATIATTSGLVNVPPTFKYALTAFEATQGDQLGAAAASRAGWEDPIKHPPWNAPTGGDMGGNRFSLTLQLDNVNFTGGAGVADREAEVDDFLTVMRHRALVLFGDPSRWSEVQPLS